MRPYTSDSSTMQSSASMRFNQCQLDVGNSAPQAAIEFPNLVLAPPVLAERDDFVLAVLVERADESLELPPVLRAGMFDPEVVVGACDGTLGPRFERIGMQLCPRHTRKDNNGPLVDCGTFCQRIASP